MESIGQIVELFHEAALFVIIALVAFTFFVGFLVVKFFKTDLGQL